MPYHHLPERFYPAIADVIMTWARLEADIDSHLGWAVQEAASPIHAEPLQISYTRRAKLLKKAVKARISEPNFFRLCEILSRIRDLKNVRDAVAHGRSWILKKGSKNKAVVSHIRWFAPVGSKRIFFEMRIDDFTPSELSRLAKRIEIERASLLDIIDPANSPGAWERIGKQLSHLENKGQRKGGRGPNPSRTHQSPTKPRKSRAQPGSSQA